MDLVVIINMITTTVIITKDRNIDNYFGRFFISCDSWMISHPVESIYSRTFCSSRFFQTSIDVNFGFVVALSAAWLSLIIFIHTFYWVLNLMFLAHCRIYTSALESVPVSCSGFESSLYHELRPRLFSEWRLFITHSSRCEGIPRRYMFCGHA